MNDAPLPIPEQVAAAQASGHPRHALELALDTWRDGRAPEVAAVVDALDAEGRAVFAAPKARTKAKFHEAWLHVAQHQNDPLATGWLAATLNVKAEVASDYFGSLRPNYVAEKYNVVLERAKNLRGRCPDPRVASALFELIAKAPFGAWSAEECAQVYDPLVDLAVRSGDPRLIERFEALLVDPRAARVSVREYLARALPRAIAQLQRVPVRPADPGWTALLPQRPTAASHKEKAALLEQIYASPDDDALRLVYADMLQLEGNPRGEFIALQLNGGKPALKKARALVKQHRETWLGPDLVRVLRSVEFERGFLARATLAQNAAATEEVWQRAYDDRRLATLVALDQGRCNATHYNRFLTGGARNLHSVYIPRSGVLTALLDHRSPTAPTAIAFGARPKRAALDKLAKAANFSALTTMTLALKEGQQMEVLSDLDATGWLDRLDALFLDPGWDGPELPDVLALWPVVIQRVSVFGCGAGPLGWVRLWREEGQTIASVRSYSGIPEVIDPDVLQALPSDVAEVRRHTSGG